MGKGAVFWVATSPTLFSPRAFAHRASPAFWAISLRSSGDNLAARALPPSDATFAIAGLSTCSSLIEASKKKMLALSKQAYTARQALSRQAYQESALLTGVSIL